MGRITRAFAALAVVAAAVGAVEVGAPGPAVAGSGAGAPGPRITVTDLRRADGTPLAQAYRINERGQVVATLPAGPEPTKAYLWDRGATAEVMSPTGRHVYPTDLTERGMVVAWDATAREEGYLPFTWKDGVSTPLPPGDHLARAGDGNARGQVAGFRVGEGGYYGPFEPVVWDEGDPVDVPTTREGIAIEVNDRGLAAVALAEPDNSSRAQAFLWEVGGELTPLPSLDDRSIRPVAINEAGVVAGVAGDAATGYRAVVWRRGRVIDLGTLGGATSHPPGPTRLADGTVALNEWGHVVGTSETARGDEHAFLWRGREMIDLGTLGGPTSEGVAVNNWGQVVGHSDTASGERHAFLWEDGRMIDLDAVAGEGTSTVADINDRGQVIGNSLLPGPDPTRPPNGVLQARLWSSPPHGLAGP